MLERFEMEGFTLSYSQAGEDLILKHIFGKNRRQGLYVDIGCNCPIQKSNTFKLYLKGWSGICVDGNENLIRQFRKIRKRDICLQEIVSDQERDVIFYQDDLNHELSSVDPEIGKDLREGSAGFKEISTRSTTLAKILEKHAGSRKIDLLCVDVENHDLEVLKGNDFKRFRPEIICAEFHGSIDLLQASELHTFLKATGYSLLALASPNVYYRSQPDKG
jgi:FkbM family methyltransferase